jgi:hypothetical protein
MQLLNCMSIIQIYQVVNLLAIRLTWNPNIRAPQVSAGIKDITSPQCPNLIRSEYWNIQYPSLLILIKPTFNGRIVHETIFRSVRPRSPAIKVSDSSHAHTKKDFMPCIQLEYFTPSTNSNPSLAKPCLLGLRGLGLGREDRLSGPRANRPALSWS